jgi:hypothetical protein
METAEKLGQGDRGLLTSRSDGGGQRGASGARAGHMMGICVLV